VPLHVIHLAVVARFEPVEQMLLVLRQFNACHTAGIKAERPGAADQLLLGVM
jgi:hypothetical protein